MTCDLLLYEFKCETAYLEQEESISEGTVNIIIIHPLLDTALFRLVRYTTEVGTRQCRVPTAIEEQSGCTS